MLKRPPIPERFSSLVAPSHRKSMRESRTRQVSDSSNILISLNASDFLESKISHLSSEIDYLEADKAGLLEMSQASATENLEIASEIQTIKYQIPAWTGQRRVGCFKAPEEDNRGGPEEDQGAYQAVTDAYASLIVNRVMGACREDRATKKRRRSGFNASTFKKDVLERHNALLEGDAWCHVRGKWFPKKNVKAAQLVPKSRESSQLLHLFGVGEMPQMGPRNGLSLHANLEEALDRGDIAIIPVPPQARDETSQWKCIVVNEKIRKSCAVSDETWDDIDGTLLKFRSEIRPAKRYLYFRYLITYFHQKQFENVKWADNPESKGHMWATPGPYLRRTMLEVLARKASDLVLPDVFWKMVPETTFEESESSPAMPPEQEELNGAFLALRCKDYLSSKQEVDDEENGEGDCGEDDD